MAGRGPKIDGSTYIHGEPKTLSKKNKEWCANEYFSVRGVKSRLMEEINKIDKDEERNDLTQEDIRKREEIKGELR